PAGGAVRAVALVSRGRAAGGAQAAAAEGRERVCALQVAGQPGAGDWADTGVAGVLRRVAALGALAAHFVYVPHAAQRAVRLPAGRLRAGEPAGAAGGRARLPPAGGRGVRVLLPDLLGAAD